MPLVEDIIAYVESLSGHPLHNDEGVHHGSSQAAVQRVLVTWMATRDALAYAGDHGYDLVLAHESLYYPYDASVRHDNPPGWLNWPTNAQRRELLERHQLNVLRVHGSLDQICILDEFASLLGMGAPVQAKGLVRVYGLAPLSLAELVAQVKARTGLPALRVSAPQGMDQVVRRVGLPLGGMGLFVNVRYQQALIDAGCDAFIAGESDNYAFRFAGECGLPVIETSHEVSENPGMRRFAAMLGTHFAEIDVDYYECPMVWQMA